VGERSHRAASQRGDDAIGLRLKLTVLTLAKWTGLFHVSRFIHRKKLLILCYHGFEIKDETRWRPKLFISSATFRARMDHLARSGCPVLALGDALERMASGRLPDDAVVITIDDGFRSVATLAWPVLQSYGFPATVYVTTYYMQRQNPIYRLAISYMLSMAAPKRLAFDGCPGMTELDLEAGRARTEADLIHHGERELSEEGRAALARRVGEATGVSYDRIVESGIFSIMSSDTVREVSREGLDVQLHTHRHTFPADDRDRARREILDNRAALEPLTGPARHFCYPSGEWQASQWAWLDELGVKSSTTCDPGLNDARTPPHALRRFLDGENIHPLEFEAELYRFAEVLRAGRRIVRRLMGQGPNEVATGR
jgi:peptidoglycan/xylan/chitin deacetylase (PgdA/CDA1 family)